MYKEITMKFFSLSDQVKGILLIIGGSILLFDTIGFTTELLHKVVFFGSIGMIILGVLMANLHKKVYRFFTKNDRPKFPES